MAPKPPLTMAQWIEKIESRRRRRARALRLFEAGDTFAEIGRKLGVSKQRAHKLVREAEAEV